MAQITIHRHKLTCPHCQAVLMSGLGQVNFRDVLSQSFACRHCGGTIITASPEAYAARKRYKEIDQQQNELLARERKKVFLPVLPGAFLVLFTAAYLFISKFGSRSIKPLAWLVIFVLSLLIGFVLAFIISSRRAASKLEPYFKETAEERARLNEIIHLDR